MPARIAIVGCGNVSRMHFATYSQHPDRVRIVAACDPVPALLAEVEQTYGVPQTFKSIEAMLNGADFDTAVVCTPTPVRQAVVEQLAAAGKHLFVEKPFADSFDEAAGMVAVGDQAGIRIGVNQNFRYHYPFDIARTLIGEGRIGPVTSILHQDLMLRRDTGWRTQTRRHAFSVMGVHWFDGLRWMLRKEATAVRSQQRSSPTIDSVGETDITAIVTFGSGTIATVVESFSCPVRRTDTFVIGEQGTIILTYAGASLYDLDGSEIERHDAPFAGPLKPGATLANLELLIAAIAKGDSPPNSGQDNLHTIALLDAAYQAAERDEIVRPRELVPA